MLNSSLCICQCHSLSCICVSICKSVFVLFFYDLYLFFCTIVSECLFCLLKLSAILSILSILLVICTKWCIFRIISVLVSTFTTFSLLPMQTVLTHPPTTPSHTKEDMVIGLMSCNLLTLL